MEIQWREEVVLTIHYRVVESACKRTRGLGIAMDFDHMVIVTALCGKNTAA